MNHDIASVLILIDNIVQLRRILIMPYDVVYNQTDNISSMSEPIANF